MLLMYFILNCTCWFFCLFELRSILHHTQSRACIPGNYFPRCPYRPRRREPVMEKERRGAARFSPHSSLLLMLTGSILPTFPASAMQPFLRGSSFSLEVQPWFQIIPGGPSTRTT